MPKAYSALFNLFVEIYSLEARASNLTETNLQTIWFDNNLNLVLPGVQSSVNPGETYSFFAPQSDRVTNFNYSNSINFDIAEMAGFDLPSLVNATLRQGTEGDLSVLEKFTTLNIISVSGGQCTCDSLAWLNSLPNLATLALNSGGTRFSGDWKNVNIEQLNVLEINFSPGLGGDLKDLPPVAIFLRIGNSGSTGKIGDLKSKTLQVIALDGCPIDPDWEGLEEFTQLRRLTLVNCGLSEAGVDSLLQKKYENIGSFTAAAPFLDVGGATNASPSGSEGDPVTANTGYGWITGLRNAGWSIGV